MNFLNTNGTIDNLGDVFEFYYTHDVNDMYIKAFHMHPVIINLNRIDLKSKKLRKIQF